MTTCEGAGSLQTVLALKAQAVACSAFRKAPVQLCSKPNLLFSSITGFTRKNVKFRLSELAIWQTFFEYEVSISRETTDGNSNFEVEIRILGTLQEL